MSKPVSANPDAGKPWYRFGIVWLVLGGPAAVVVAGIVTAVIAYHGADPVVQNQPGAVAAKVGR